MKKWSDNINLDHLISGLTGGIASTLCLHPFDLVKIRFQVTDGSVIKHRQVYNGVSNAFMSIFREGGVRGLYQGVSPNIAGAASSWGLYFFGFDFFKSTLKDFKGCSVLSATDHLSCGALAGITTLSITNPIWVVKTRMCLQPATAAEVPNSQRYNGVIDGLVKLFKQEGIRGYYRGFLPGIFGVSHGALQFMAYEELKKAHSNYTGVAPGNKLNPFVYIGMSALSKVFAVVTTYPYQVVRSRLQDAQLQHKYAGAVDVVVKVWRFEGARGYYKGMGVSLLRVTPQCCITFLVYENIVHLLKSNDEIT